MDKWNKNDPIGLFSRRGHIARLDCFNYITADLHKHIADSCHIPNLLEKSIANDGDVFTSMGLFIAENIIEPLPYKHVQIMESLHISFNPK